MSSRTKRKERTSLHQYSIFHGHSPRVFIDDNFIVTWLRVELDGRTVNVPSILELQIGFPGWLSGSA